MEDGTTSAALRYGEPRLEVPQGCLAIDVAEPKRGLFPEGLTIVVLAWSESAGALDLLGEKIRAQPLALSGELAAIFADRAEVARKVLPMLAVGNPPSRE